MVGLNKIRVIPVQGDKEFNDFLRLPWRIYQHDPYWVAPILSHQRKFLDRHQGPFFEIGEAQYFLAYLDGEPVGRLSAHLNRLYDQYHDQTTGFFGFFECIPDQQVADALFAAAAASLRQRGKKRLVGPLNFSIYDEMGLLVDGFNSLPAMLQTYNPLYYEELLTGQGFRKAMDWYALKITNRNVDAHALEERLKKIMQGQSLTFTTFRPRELTRRAEEVYALFNESWSHNWGHVPLTRRQFQALFRELKPLLRPDLVNLILDGDRLAAFSITVPDLNPALQKLDGRLNLLDQLKLLYEAKFKTFRKARALVLGVRQAYQTRRLHHALILRTYLNIVQHTPCEMCDLSLIPENLEHYLKILQAFGGQRYKTFRVFEKEI